MAVVTSNVQQSDLQTAWVALKNLVFGTGLKVDVPLSGSPFNRSRSQPTRPDQVHVSPVSQTFCFCHIISSLYPPLFLSDCFLCLSMRELELQYFIDLRPFHPLSLLQGKIMIQKTFRMQYIIVRRHGQR